MRVLTAVVLTACFTAAWIPSATAAGACPAPRAGHPPPRWRGQYRWQALEAAHYRIGAIHVHVAQVYELDKPRENTWYARIADALHIRTHANVVRNQLLFASGDPVRASLIYQTERRLRRLSYLRRVAITPGACNGGRVAVNVEVKDAWTLKPEITFKRVGGQNIVNFRLKDENLFGFGKTVEFGHIHGTQRDENYVSYIDPAVAGSRWQLSAGAANLSDGFSRALSLNRPFVTDRTPWAGGAGFLDQKADVNFYNRGHRAWSAADMTRQLTLSWSRLIAFDGVNGWRAGARYIDESYRYGPLVAVDPALRPPPALSDRQFRGVQGTLSFFQDRYANFHDLKLVDRVEDYNLGWTGSAALGYFPTAFGSSTGAWIGGLAATYGARLPWQSVLFVNAGAGGRRARGAWRGAYADTEFTFYNHAFANQTLVAHFTFDWQLRPDPEDQLYLGGLTGLRGYPNYFRAGERRWLLTLADRIDTGIDIWQTLRLGYVAFFDAGRIDAPGAGGWSRTFSDIGGGLRFGNLRGAFASVIYVTAAVPLVRPDGISAYQIVVGDVVDF